MVNSYDVKHAIIQCTEMQLKQTTINFVNKQCLKSYQGLVVLK